MKKDIEMKELLLKEYTDKIKVQSLEPDAKYSAETSLEKLMERISADTKRDKKPLEIYYRRWAIAASFAALLAIGSSFFFHYSNSMPEFIVAENTSTLSKSLLLEDGTKVNLNAKTKLIYPSKFYGRNREVFLVGEAYFDVVHDRKHAFIVRAGNLNIKVLGTCFNVNAYPNSKEITTTLIEGSVEVNNSLGGDKIIMEPNQILSYNTTNGDMVLDNITDANRYILWTKGIWSFNQMKMIDICAHIEHVFGVKIIISDKTLLNKKFTGEFHNKESLEDFFNVVRITTPFTYKRNGDIIEIE